MMRNIRNFLVRTCVLLSAVILACVLAGVGVGPAAAAPVGQASTGMGTITGQVLSLDNFPLPNVQLAAFGEPQTTPNRAKLGEVVSDAQGRYSIQVPPGRVWMQFVTQNINGQSFWGYDNKPVDIAAGQTIQEQDFRVAIRIVSAPPTPVQPAPTPAPTPISPPPGMPRTGAGPDMWLPLLAGGLGLLLLLAGLTQHRRAPR